MSTRSIVMAAAGAVGGPFNNWVNANSSINVATPGGGSCIASSGSMWVVGSSSGFILTSPDANSWTVRQPFSSLTTISIIWDGSTFVALVGSGTRTSTDGINWTFVANVGAPVSLTDIVKGSSDYVVVGNNGYIYKSANLTTWTNTNSTGQNLFSVAASSSLFVAVGSSGTIRTSPDGTTWTLQTSGTTAVLRSVVWSAATGLFVVVGDNGTILTSADGVTWTSRTSGSSNTFYGVSCDSTYIIACSDQTFTNSTANILVSTDGVTWTGYVTPATVLLNAIGVASSKYVAVGASVIQVSTNLTAWSIKSTSNSVSNILSQYGLAYSSSLGLFVAAGGGASLSAGLIRTSPDGVIWTDRSSGLSGALLGVFWDGTRFFTYGSAGIASSTDGISWTVVNIGQPNVFCMAYSSSLGLHVWGGQNGSIRTSSDNGINWTSRTSNTSQSRFAIVWTGSQFVSAGLTTAIISTDGIAWTAYSLPAQAIGLAWSSTLGLYVIGCNNGAIYSSPDAINWTLRTTGTTNSFQHVSWTGTEFIATASVGTLLTSTDGITWVTRSSGTTANLYGSASNGAVAVITGGAFTTRYSVLI